MHDHCTKTVSAQQPLTDPVTYPLPTTPSGVTTPTAVRRKSSSSFVSTPTRISFEATPILSFQSLL